MSIQWHNGHILWSNGHIAMSSNCCCKPDPCCCCCPCYDFKLRMIYEGTTYDINVKLCRTSDIMWHSPTGDWELKRLGYGTWSLAGVNPPVSFQGTNMICPDRGTWSAGDTPAGGTWSILSVSCDNDCGRYTDSPTISFTLTGMAAPNPQYTWDFVSTYSGKLTRSQNFGNCRWETNPEIPRTSGNGPLVMGAVVWRSECSWNVEIRNGAMSIGLSTGNCANSHEFCDSVENYFMGTQGGWWDQGTVGNVKVENIVISSGGIAPSMANIEPMNIEPSMTASIEPIIQEQESEPTKRKPCRCSRKKRLGELSQ